MTISEKIERITLLRRAKKNFEQSLLLCIVADIFVVYETIRAAAKDKPVWYFYLTMGAVFLLMAAVAFLHYRKCKRAESEIAKLIEEIHAENPKEKIPEDTDQRRFF